MEHIKFMTMFRLASAVFMLLIGCRMLPVTQADAVAHAMTHKTAFMHPTQGPRARVKHLHTAGGFNLVPEPTLMLDYHFGPVMSGRDDMIKLFVSYYGDFSRNQRTVLRTFFKSFWNPKTRVSGSKPTAARWWQLTRNYVDFYNSPVARSIIAAGEMSDNYSLGKDISQADIQALVVKSMKKFGTDARSMYLVLTAQDVLVEGFCMSVCGTHFYTFPSDATKSQMVPYGWVGNPAKQCTEFCSWPFAAGGSLNKGLIPPNGDAGLDGMIVTIANLLSGMGTNPYGNAYYQPDGLEAAGACQGVYGPGSFPGYPGELSLDKTTGASFNVYGASNKRFLLPWIWDPTTLQCTGQA